MSTEGSNGDTFTNPSGDFPSRSLPFPSFLPQSTHPPPVLHHEIRSAFGTLFSSSTLPLPQNHTRPSIPRDPRLTLAPVTRYPTRALDVQQTQLSGWDRVKQACGSCRKKKVRCDGERPRCSHCSEHRLECVYREVTFKVDYYTRQLLDRVDLLEKNWMSRQDSLEETLMEQQKALGDWFSSDKHVTVASYRDIQVANTPYTVQEDPIKDDLDGELTIPIGHTTAAHNLLSWPSVQELLQPVLVFQEYVIRLEAERLRITSDFYELEDPSVIVNETLDIELSGLFNVDARTTHHYYQSYLRRIHNMHPFLDPIELNRQVNHFTEYYCCEHYGPYPQPPVERNLCNATVLLVLAIGAFCDRPSPLGFPPIKNTPIPGLSLYGFAASILGQLHGMTHLKHAQACLLAGIYIGQFAHPYQSYSWISQASWVCQILIRPRRYRILHESVKDSCRFTYWTCLQLESNILAELDLPPTGLSRFESQIELPTGKPALIHSPNAPIISIMLFYSAQIHLRKILNRVHTELYQVEHEKQAWSSTVQEALSTNLERWRASLPDTMKWMDYEPPAIGINTARMRAKFYGAQYIIYRPLLYRAIHSTLGANEELPQPLLEACKICINSAILNTMAFDRVEGRIIVTNIFGIAHEQFGNMLVLSATYMSNLRELVDKFVLKRLLCKTIRFLKDNGSGSPLLEADAEILTIIQGKIFAPAN